MCASRCIKLCALSIAQTHILVNMIHMELARLLTRVMSRAHTADTSTSRYHGGALEELHDGGLVPHPALVAEAQHMRLQTAGHTVRGRRGGATPAGGAGRAGWARGAGCPAARL